jgi:hypothetical protein
MPDALATLLDKNLSQGAPSPLELPSVEAIVESLTRAGRTEMAELLAGTTNKRSREYKAARRRVTRWQQRGVGRITPKSQRQLEGVRRRFPESERVTAFRTNGAYMRVQIAWYEGHRTEWLPPGKWVGISAVTMRSVVRYWVEGDSDTAAGALYSAFLEAYEVPNIDDWQMETEVIGLELEPAK